LRTYYLGWKVLLLIKIAGKTVGNSGCEQRGPAWSTA
jgi:hypothetical protein